MVVVDYAMTFEDNAETKQYLMNLHQQTLVENPEQIDVQEEKLTFVDNWSLDFEIPDRSTMPIDQDEFWNCLIESQAHEPLRGRQWWEVFDPEVTEVEVGLWEEYKPEL
jgi:hypothetical protein